MATVTPPGDLCRPGTLERPAWMGWIDRDMLMQLHPRWSDGVRQMTEQAPADSGRRLRWAATTLDNLAKPGRFTSGALVDINAPGDLPDTFVGPLVDQGRHFVRHEIRFNRIAYEFGATIEALRSRLSAKPGAASCRFSAGFDHREGRLAIDSE